MSNSKVLNGHGDFPSTHYPCSWVLSRGKRVGGVFNCHLVTRVQAMADRSDLKRNVHFSSFPWLFKQFYIVSQPEGWGSQSRGKNRGSSHQPNLSHPPHASRIRGNEPNCIGNWNPCFFHYSISHQNKNCN